MNEAQAGNLCESMLGATFDYPFGPGVRVYRVAGKMFALLSHQERRLNLKCDPALADLLRAQFAAITPGYHQDKRHWNTVILDGSVPDAQIEEMIRHSHALVFDALPKKTRARVTSEPRTSV